MQSNSIFNSIMPMGILSWINSKWNGHEVTHKTSEQLDSVIASINEVDFSTQIKTVNEVVSDKTVEQKMNVKNDFFGKSQYLTIMDQIEEIIRDPVLLESYIEWIFSTHVIKDEKRLHEICSIVNQICRKMFYPGEFEKQDEEWIDSLKKIWLSKEKVIQNANSIWSPPSKENKLRLLLLKFNAILTNSELLKKMALDFLSHQENLSKKQFKQSWVYFLNLMTHRQQAIYQLLSNELEFNPSVAIALKPLIPNFDDQIAASPFSKKQTLANHFESQNIAGIPEGLNEIVMTIAAAYDSTYKSVVDDIGIYPERGMILYGPPGTGKTVIAKAVAEYFGCSSQEIKFTAGSNLLDKWLGNTEKGIRNLFEDARNNPDRLHVIVIDEIDALLSNRTQAITSYETTRVTQFLTEIDGINSPQNIFVIGITNHLEHLDPAAIRPGRLGALVEVPLPNMIQRQHIFELYLKKINQEYLVEEYAILAEKLAQITEGFSGAEIRAAVQRTSSNAFMKIIRDLHFSSDSFKKEQLNVISEDDFVETINLINQKKV